MSHSGQLQGTVNPSSSEYVGSNPTTPTLPPKAFFNQKHRFSKRSNFHNLRKFYALDCSKLQQFSFHFSQITPNFRYSSLFLVKQVRQVKPSRKKLSHLKNSQVKQVLQLYVKAVYFDLEVRKICVKWTLNFMFIWVKLLKDKGFTISCSSFCWFVVAYFY